MKAKQREKGPKKDQKGQNQDKRDQKDYWAKFRNTFTSVYVSLGNAPDAPPHLYNWDNCTLLRCLLVSCHPSKDDNLKRALYNEGYRCLVQKLNICLLIRHIRFLSDRVDAACFPVPPLSLLKSLTNRVKLERLPSVNRFLTVFFLIWMELLFKTFIAFFLAFTLFFAFLLLVGFCFMIINNDNSKLM